MDKFNPTYDLDEFKRSDFKITKIAQKNAYDLGFNKEKINKVVATME